jgi:hypothetical protein
MEPVAQTYDWCWRNEKYLRNTESLARVAVVYSQRTARRYGAKVDDHINGFYHSLIEARVPFEMAHDELLDGAAQRNKLLILPNTAALSDAQCNQIRAFVKAAGASSRHMRPRCTTSRAGAAKISVSLMCLDAPSRAKSRPGCRMRT